jgi:hypothetical protein
MIGRLVCPVGCWAAARVPGPVPCAGGCQELEAAAASKSVRTAEVGVATGSDISGRYAC